MTIEQLYTIYQQYPSVVTDSRKVQSGDLFFALKGPNFNGNLYAEQAIKDGAAYAVIDEDIAPSNDKCILVPDVLECLQQLAFHHRSQFDIPFIAITGSNGKTTTKELVHAVLSTKYKTYTTKGNLNNHIGIPLTLLSIQKDAEIAVIEMGANHLGEIASYCTYTDPTIGIITNCGKAHLEGFGSEQGVRKGKGELFDYLRAHQGTSFAFADYPYFASMTSGIAHQYWYSADLTCQILGLNAVGSIQKSDPFLEISLQPNASSDKAVLNIHSRLVGAYNLPNLLCAISLGRYFKIPETLIQAGIEGYTPSNSRSQLIEKGRNKIILDAYNANPSSMQAAIQNFSRMQAASKVLILGGMKELGEQSKLEHQKLVQFIKSLGGWKQVLLIGPEFEQVAEGYSWFKDSAAAKDYLSKAAFTEVLMLIKGSRSNALEALLEVL